LVHKLTEGTSGRVHQLQMVISHRKTLDRPDVFNIRDAAFPGGHGLYRDGRALLVAVAVHSTLGTQLYNEVRAGIHRTPVWFARESEDPGSWIIPFPQGTGNSPQEPTLQTSYRNTPVYQLADNFSLVRDKHLFKWGAEMRSTSVAGWSLNGPESVGIVPHIVL